MRSNVSCSSAARGRARRTASPAPPRRRRRTGSCADSARQAGTGSPLPLSSSGRELLVADRLRRRATRLLVDDEASDRRCSLEPGGGVDDVAGGDSLARCRAGRRAATTASPVATAARTDEIELLVLRSARRSRRGSAAPRARRARRRPRAPPARRRPPSRRRRRTSRRCRRSARSRVETRSWYGRSVARTSSGSARSAPAVKPTRSTKSTETTLRSSPAGAASSAVPQARQKRARSGFSSPQFGQTIIAQVYELGTKLTRL